MKIIRKYVEASAEPLRAISPNFPKNITSVIPTICCNNKLIKNENIDLKFSQEDILQFLKDCPEHRLW